MTSAEAEAAARHGERATVAYVALEGAGNGKSTPCPMEVHLVFDAARLYPRCVQRCTRSGPREEDLRPLQVRRAAGLAALRTGEAHHDPMPGA